MPISTAVDASAIARTVGVKTEKINTDAGTVKFLPQKLAIFGQGDSTITYPLEKVEITSAYAAGEMFGFGSPIHLAMLQLRPVNGDGVKGITTTVYPLANSPTGDPALGDIALSGSVTKAASFVVNISGFYSIPFSVAVGDTLEDIAIALEEAVSANINMPMNAAASEGSVFFQSKWVGTSANALKISVVGASDSGLTFAITDPVGGTENPLVDSALAKIGSSWETMALNCLEIDDTAALNGFYQFGEGRWGGMERKPIVVFTGQTLETVDEVSVFTDNRTQDKTNVTLSNPGSVSLPFVSAAGQLARIIQVANDKPAWDYGRQQAQYIEAGADGIQWDYPTRNEAVKSGISTIEVRDGIVNVSDTVTMYRPAGEAVPAYRFVKDIVSLMTVIYNVDLIFNNPEWDGAPLIPDNQPTTNSGAKKPKNARSVLSALADNLGLDAIISDPKFTKENIVAEIDSQNPNRLNVVFPVKLAGNVNIISIDLNFGFFFGSQTSIS